MLALQSSSIGNPAQFTYFAGRPTWAVDRVGSAAGGTGYTPYGVERVPSANDAEKFATYYRDAKTGFDYAVNRYYWSGLGRFLTPDPYMATAEGANDPSTPQSWNRYGYAMTDPLNRYDPQGLNAPFPPTGDAPPEYGWIGPWWDVTPGSEGGGIPVFPDPVFTEYTPTGGGGGGGGRATKPKICDSAIMAPEITTIFSEMGAHLGLDPEFIMAVAVQESGWNLSHVYQTNSTSDGKPLNNLFGLTNAGGNNLRFDSIRDSAAYWEKIWGPFLSDQPKTISAFVFDLVKDPKHMYNANADWQTAIIGGTFENGPSAGKKTVGTYRSVVNALANCDVKLR
jgi:RHS repeat-associated protein